MTETLHHPTPDALRARILTALEGLGDRGFVTIGEPAPPEPPRQKGLRGLLKGRAPVPATRFVQALRQADQLSVECVGAVSFGGPYEIADGTDAAVRALGFRGPGDADYESMGGPQYRAWVPFADAERAADMLASALELLGATTELEVTTGP